MRSSDKSMREEAAVEGNTSNRSLQQTESGDVQIHKKQEANCSATACRDPIPLTSGNNSLAKDILAISIHRHDGRGDPHEDSGCFPTVTRSTTESW